MKRFFYRCLIWLHPTAFRERFGDEMLYIFEETAGAGTARLFADSLISLLRQWLVRSGAWKLALGTAMSSLVFVVLASSLAFSQRASNDGYVRRDFQSHVRPMSPLDRAAFSRSAAQAVALLARFQKDHERKRRPARHPVHNPPASPSPDSRSNPS